MNIINKNNQLKYKRQQEWSKWMEHKMQKIKQCEHLKKYVRDKKICLKISINIFLKKKKKIILDFYEKIYK